MEKYYFDRSFTLHIHVGVQVGCFQKMVVSATTVHLYAFFRLRREQGEEGGELKPTRKSTKCSGKNSLH